MVRINFQGLNQAHGKFILDCWLESNTCVELCPEVFVFDEEAEKARVIKETGGPEDEIQEAIDSCPSECIHWEE